MNTRSFNGETVCKAAVSLITEQQTPVSSVFSSLPTSIIQIPPPFSLTDLLLCSSSLLLCYSLLLTFIFIVCLFITSPSPSPFFPPLSFIRHHFSPHIILFSHSSLCFALFFFLLPSKKLKRDNLNTEMKQSVHRKRMKMKTEQQTEERRRSRRLTRHAGSYVSRLT